MKFLFTLFLLLVSQAIHAQIPQVEKDLNAAEQELIQMEQEFDQLKAELKEKDQRPKDNFEYLQLKSNIQLQKKKTRQLRRAYKDYRKEQKNLQKEQATTGTNQNMTADNKAEIKQLNKDIKQLNKQRKEIIQSEINAGRDPMKSQIVQQLDQLILTKTDRITALENNPTVTLPARQTTPSKQDKPQANQQPVQQSTISQNNVPAKATPPIGLETILFAKFSTEVQNDYAKYLNYVAKQLSDDQELRLVIDAYTDNSEKNRVSRELSEKMAHNTAQEFVNRGISPDRLIVRAFGSKKALADNSKFFGQARNRRVELSFIY